MSCYNWERGTIKIPSKAWKGLRDSLVDKANEKRAQTLKTALAIHACLSNKDTIQAAREAVKVYNKTLKTNERIKLKDVTPQAIFSAINDGWGRLYNALEGVRALRGAKIPSRRVSTGWGQEDGVDYETQHAISRMLFPYVEKDGKRVQKRLAKPKKSDPVVKPLVRTKVDQIDGPDCTITFDHKAKTVTWNVEENNRSVERANGSWLGVLFFRLLGRITWTRGSGGQIVGNDEYNRDSYSEGGGGNYVTKSFGPESNKAKRQRGMLAWRGF